MIKNFIPILTFFLIAVVAFFAFQIIEIVNKEAIPPATQKEIQPLNPKLNTAIIDQLKKANQ